MTATLSFVRDDGPGIRRKGKKRFAYVTPSGREVSRADRDRIVSLAIPPAWTDVWICPDADGHIQATGRDARGRKQYRYHPAYRRRRENAKFRNLVEFGEGLGALRKQIDKDLRSPALSRERILAAIVSLLDRTYVRVGNESYARSNKTFGLSTLRCRHVDVHGETLRLHFTGKGGKEFDVACCDGRLARVVRRCQELPGQVLFQYVDDDGSARPVTSTEINEYLRDAVGADVTAKSFRTWGASLLAAQGLSNLEVPDSDAALRRVEKAALQPVADQLGNTVAVCRASYVHPKVLRAFEAGTLATHWAKPTRAAGGLVADERRLLRLLTS